MAAEKNLRAAMNFNKKTCLAVITWNKKRLSKPEPITYAPEETFFVVATFRAVSFQTEQITCSVL